MRASTKLVAVYASRKTYGVGDAHVWVGHAIHDVIALACAKSKSSRSSAIVHSGRDKHMHGHRLGFASGMPIVCAADFVCCTLTASNHHGLPFASPLNRHGHSASTGQRHRRHARPVAGLWIEPGVHSGHDPAAMHQRPSQFRFVALRLTRQIHA